MRTIVLVVCGLVTLSVSRPAPADERFSPPAKALEPFSVLHTLPIDSGYSTSFAFAPDGRVLAVVDGVEVRFWNPRTGKQASDRWAFEARPGTVGLALFLAFSDAKTIALSRNRNDITLLEYPSGRKAHSIGFAQPVRSDGWIAVPGLIACAGFDNKRSVVRFRTGPKWTESGHAVLGAAHPDAFAVSPDRSELAVVTGDGRSVQIHSVADGKLLRSTNRGTLSVGGLREFAYSPDGRQLAFPFVAPARAGRKLGMTLLDTKAMTTRTLLWGEPAARPPDPMGCAFSADGKTLIVPCRSDSVRLYEVQTGKLRHVGAAPTQAQRFGASPDGRLFVLAGARRVFVVDWRAASAGAVLARAPATLWADLASPDSAVGYRAVVALGAKPADAVKLVAANLKPAATPNAAAVNALVADLDANDFRAREAAQKGLETLGELVESELRVAAKSASPERRDRANELLKGLARGDFPERLRALRAVEVLEYIGTPAAREVLQALADGLPGAALTRDARAALDRLKTFGPNP